MKKILAIDDDYDFLRLLSEIIPSETYELMPCPDPAEALDLARATHPDLILVDLWLPQMSGYELIFDLLREDATKEVPILVCSGVVGDADRTLAFLLRQGAHRVAVLTKPFSPEDLLDQLARLTSRGPGR